MEDRHDQQPARIESINASRFSLPTDNQSSSHLARLPKELLTKILQYLHHLDGPISPRPPESIRTRQKTGLSAQMLRTCQRFYHEGHSILYANTLDVHCEVSLSGGSFKLEGSVDLKLFTLTARCAFDDPIADSSLGLLTSRASHPDQSERVPITSRTSAAANLDRFAAICSGLSQTQRPVMLHLKTTDESTSSDKIGVACYLLRGALKDKALMLNFDDVAVNQWNEKYLLQPCRAFRCKSIEIEGLKDSDLTDSTMQRLTAEITGETTPRDLVEEYTSFVRAGQKLPSIREVGMKDDYCHPYTDVWDATPMDDLRYWALSHNVIEFDQTLQKIIDDAEENLAREVAEKMEEVQKLEALKKRYIVIRGDPHEIS